MDNYSRLQKILHNICLSNNFIKKISFEFEILFFNKKYNNFSNNEHLFISGLARSGTTAILNYIYGKNVFASLTYNDMPFILSPNLFKFLNNKNDNKVSLRLHRDGIKYSYKSPEALDEIFWNTFNEDEAYSFLSKYISQILIKYRKNRYLSKNNYNYKRIKTIKSIFPNSYFLITYRNPLHHAYSLLRQHLNFIQLQSKDKFILKYMNWLGHNEFGNGYRSWQKPIKYNNVMDINHWLEQWYLFYNNLIENNLNYERLILISYEDLCSNKKVLSKLLNILKLDNKTHDDYFISSNKPLKIEYDENLLNKSIQIYEKLTISSKNILNIK